MGRSHKAVTLLQHISLVAAGVMIAFILLEVYLRISGYSPIVLLPPFLFESHPIIGWTLRPKYNRVIETPVGPVRYAINAQGIRAAADFSTSPDPTRQRMFIIGDSFTFGTSVNEEDTFPSLLNESMKSQRMPVEFVNLGVPGFGTVHSYERLVEYSHILGVPNTVIYLFCPNDPVDNIAGKREVVNGIRIDSHRSNKVLLSYVARAYNELRSMALVLDFYYSRFDNPRKFTRREFNRQSGDVRSRQDFAVTEKYLSTIIGWTKQNNANFVVVTTSHSPYSAPLKTMLWSRGIRMIEADEIFAKANADNQSLYLFDGIHWNKRGHELIARGIEELLTEIDILRKPPGLNSTIAAAWPHR
jgi:GDSL-like Lipase/Acylhydrolase family